MNVKLLMIVGALALSGCTDTKTKEVPTSKGTFIIKQSNWLVVAQDTENQYRNGTSPLKVGDSCFGFEGAKLVELIRNEKIFEYQYDGDTLGTPCPTGTKVFYGN